MQANGTIPPFEGPEDILRRRGNAERSSLETQPIPSASKTGNILPNTPLAASTISFLLGCVFTFGITVFLSDGPGAWWRTPQLGFYIASWAAFHWGEFAVTAGWNREKCSVDSFLLENGMMYHIAHGVALTEYLITLWFKPEYKNFRYVSLVGMILVVAGQTLRSAAMIHASTNFSHAVAFRKLESHKLVTDGIYAWFRHPSYTGFFYWALGTQLLLQNPISCLGFTAVLWRFFSSRIKFEEQALVRFFGQDYVQYRSKVGTHIPFIP